MAKSLRIIMGTVLGNLLFVIPALARAGGGGSSSGGGHSGGGGGGLLGFLMFLILITVAWIAEQRLIKKNRALMQTAASSDAAWDENALKERVRSVFFKFQAAWSTLDPAPMQEFLTESYFKRMVLEMNVLQNLHRKNQVNNPQILDLHFKEVVDKENDADDYVVVSIKAEAQDILLDTESNKTLYKDRSSFTEFWKFVRVGDVWKLDGIDQQTAEPSLYEEAIEQFASKNGFYFDADFGWLMMPHKGVLFGATNFGTSDLNNHVVGYYRNKIVEFYTYKPKPTSNFSDTYLVAQAILPIKYENILVKKKNRLFNFTPRGLRRIELESAEFNDKFCLFASPQDQVNSLELLTPNFMLRIYDLPFSVSIEIVGNVLYLYVKNYSASHYPEMLEVLSWAFDEMKM